MTQRRKIRNPCWLCAILPSVVFFLLRDSLDDARQLKILAGYALAVMVLCAVWCACFGLAYTKKWPRPSGAVGDILLNATLSLTLIMPLLSGNRTVRESAIREVCLISAINAPLLGLSLFWLLVSFSLSGKILNFSGGRVRYRKKDLMAEVDETSLLGLLFFFVVCVGVGTYINSQEEMFDPISWRHFSFLVFVALCALACWAHTRYFLRQLLTLRYLLRHHPGHPQTRLLLRQMERQRPLYIVAAGLLCAGFALWVWSVFVPAAFY